MMNFFTRLFTRKKKKQQVAPFTSSAYPKHTYHKSLRDADQEDYDYNRRQGSIIDFGSTNNYDSPHIHNPSQEDYTLPSHEFGGGNFGGGGAGGTWNDDSPSVDSGSDSGSCDSGGSSD